MDEITPPPPPQPPSDEVPATTITTSGHGSTGSSTGTSTHPIQAQVKHLLQLPQAIFSPICSFLSEGDVGNLARCSKACLSFYHHMPSISFLVTDDDGEREAMESLRTRLVEGPGILHLRFIQFALDEDDDQGGITSFVTPLMSPYLTALEAIFIGGALSKLPCLTALDVHPLVLSSPEQLRGLSSLPNLRDLSLPVFLRPSATTTTTTTTDTPFHLYEEINTLSRLVNFHAGFSEWNVIRDCLFPSDTTNPVLWATRIRLLCLSGLIIRTEPQCNEVMAHLRRSFTRLETLQWQNQDEKVSSSSSSSSS